MRMHKLQFLRRRKGMSQKDVSDFLGISVYMYQKIEQGSRTLTIDVAKKLVQLLEVSYIDDLLDEAI